MTSDSYSEDLYAVDRGDTVQIWNTGLEENCGSRFDFEVAVHDLLGQEVAMLVNDV